MARTDQDRWRWLAQQDRTAFLRQAIDIAMDGLYVEYNILAEIRNLRQEIRTMSGTLNQQVTDATAAIRADIEAVAADATTIAAQIAALQAQLQPGNAVTQEQVDALNALKSNADAAKATLDSMATPTPVPPVTP